ncbi:MAG TPA: nuclear transport factor 2 family protein [Solirubrobacteraceae bacterium]|nr:nuclear transport factor 2 family protein [Solirubrobacteraceae bacterium]
MEGSHDLVRRLWTAYREGGVETALALLHPDVEFVAVDGTTYDGHDGVRSFFKSFADQGQTFEASPYSFEGQGDAVLVAGHRRIHSAEGTSGAYLYFVHVIRDGSIARLSAHATREAALGDLRRNELPGQRASG